MRFTISFIILLTLWSALAVQTFLGQRKTMYFKVREAQVRASTDESAAQIAQLQSRPLDRQIEDLSRQTDEQERLLDSLRSTFEESVNKLTELQPASEKLSIRSLPVFGEPHRDSFHFLVSIPQGWELGLQLILTEIVTEQAGGDPPQPSTDLSLAFEGEIPPPVPLSPGTHRIALSICRRVGEEPAEFTAVVDGIQVCCLKATATNATGWITGSTSWSKQKDYAKNRLPSLLDARVKDSKAVIWVQLAELHASSGEGDN